jgi:hypothetical protein
MKNYRQSRICQAVTANVRCSKTWAAVGGGVRVGFDAPDPWERAGAVRGCESALYN